MTVEPGAARVHRLGDARATREYTWEAAREAEHRVDRLLLIGWLWRKQTTRHRWHLTTDLDGRAYPGDAVFVPVYAGTT